MSYTQISARVVDQTVQLVNLPRLASGSEGVLQIRGTFDEAWDGYGKVAVFYRSPEEVYHIPLVDDVATVPHEVLAEEGFFYFGYMGVEDNTRTTEVVMIRVEQGALSVATAEPQEPTPDIYQQLVAAYNVAARRVDELLATKSTGGVTNFALSDEYIGGTIRSNGASAYIQFDITKMSLVAGGHHYSDYCIIPALAPLGPVYLESSNPDIDITIEPPNAEGWARILIENVGNTALTTDMTVTATAYYPLAHLSIGELADIRVGFDGTVHTSAGTAVRDQVLMAILNASGGGSGGGLSYAAAQLLVTILEGGVFTSDQSQRIKTLEQLLGVDNTEEV